MQTGPRITLCVIAKNEEANLPGCLASVQGIVSAVVVVDTGSTDDTVRIARGEGATVVHFPWNDDFAAARNAALPYVETEFILVLDADERLMPGAGAALLQSVTNPSIDCGLLPLHNAPRLDASAEEVLRSPATLLPRLLRRTADLAWFGRVHESVGRWAEARPGRVTAVPAAIRHHGALPEVRQRLKKAERNVRLLRLRVAEEPENPTIRAFLAEEMSVAGHVEAATAEVAAAWELLVRAWEPRDGGAPVHRPPPVGILQRHASRLLAAGEVEAAADAVAKVEGWVGNAHPAVRFLCGRIEEIRADAADGNARRERLVSALQSYRAVARQHGVAYPEPSNPEVTGIPACTRLAAVLLKLGAAEHAWAVTEGAIEQHGPTDALRCALAEAALLRHTPAAALTAIGHDGAGSPIDRADAWTLAAEAYTSLGRRDEGAAAAARARRTTVWFERHRVDRLVRLEDALGLQRHGFGPGSFPKS